jgi:hypothetical protein
MREAQKLNGWQIIEEKHNNLCWWFRPLASRPHPYRIIRRAVSQICEPRRAGQRGRARANVVADGKSERRINRRNCSRMRSLILAAEESAWVHFATVARGTDRIAVVIFASMR